MLHTPAYDAFRRAALDGVPLEYALRLATSGRPNGPAQAKAPLPAARTQVRKLDVNSDRSRMAWFNELADRLGVD